MRSRRVGRVRASSLWTRAVCFVMVLAAGPTGATAQSNPDEAAEQAVPGRLRLVSEPSGAVVTLIGDHRWRGTTPWEVDRGLTGSYEVSAKLRGYERWHREIDLRPGEDRELNIRLSPKRQWKAVARSLLVPGWGQFYGDQTRKGTAFLLGTAAGGIALAWTHEAYQDEVDDYRRAREAYFDEDRLEELPALKSRADGARRAADRAYDRRTAALAVTGGFYLVSILDAALLFPSPSEGSFAAISPWGSDGPRLSLAPRGVDGLALSVDLRGPKGGSR